MHALIQSALPFDWSLTSMLEADVTIETVITATCVHSLAGYFPQLQANDVHESWLDSFVAEGTASLLATSCEIKIVARTWSEPCVGFMCRGRWIRHSGVDSLQVPVQRNEAIDSRGHLR